MFTPEYDVYSVEAVDTAKVSEMDDEESFQRGRARPSLGSISICRQYSDW